MNITLIQSADNLDPNSTAENPEQSLKNYVNEVTAAIRAEWSEAEVDHRDEDGTYAWTLTGYEKSDRDQVEFRIQAITEEIFEAGNFWA